VISIRALILGGLSLDAGCERIFRYRPYRLPAAVLPAESTLYIANSDGSEEKPSSQQPVQ